MHWTVFYYINCNNACLRITQILLVSFKLNLKTLYPLWVRLVECFIVPSVLDSCHRVCKMNFENKLLIRMKKKFLFYKTHVIHSIINCSLYNSVKINNRKGPSKNKLLYRKAIRRKWKIIIYKTIFYEASTLILFRIK